MNTHIKKIVGFGAAAAITLGFSVGAYAMSDDDFKAQLLEQLKIEAKLSPEEIEYVSGKIDDLSRQDILISLEEEIAELDDTDLQSKATADLESLKSVSDIDQFFDDLDVIYEYIDAYYEENGHFDEEDEDYEDYNFEEEKAFIIAEGKEELQYITDPELKKMVEQAIVELEGINDEDEFFDRLDEIYEKIDEHFWYEDEDYDDEWEDYDFEELREEIIEEVWEELNFIKDEALKAKVKDTLADLVKETDEDAFFEILDDLYEDEDLEAYYEEEGIDVLMEDDFFEGDFNFEEERQEIIEELNEELSEIDDTTLVSELQSMIEELESEDNEHAFFDALDEIYEKIDNHYGIDWDDEDWEEYEDYDFEEERKEIIKELNEEISEWVDDSELQTSLYAMVTELEAIQDEDAFFDKLDEIYEKVDAYFEENGYFDEDEDDEEDYWNEDDEDEWDNEDDFDDEDEDFDDFDEDDFDEDEDFDDEDE